MPEGDTVWRTAQRLHSALSGRPLTSSDFRVPRWAELDLTGQTVIETVSRGKHLLTRLPQVTIHSHLKMEGSWHIYQPGSRWRSAAAQARVVLATDRWQAVGFRLGLLEIVERSQEASIVGHLGPDLLGPDWRADEALARLLKKPDVPLGEALLDQRNLAGIGNMYKAELCFMVGVHPRTRVGEVVALPRLLDRAHQLLDANKQRAQQTTTGDLRRGRQLWVYNRQGQPCRRCRTPIASRTFSALGDAERREDKSAAPTQNQARVDCWCPTCQPETTPAKPE